MECIIMADRTQLEDALVAAHNAGDTEAATIIAGEINALSKPVAQVQQVPLSDRLARQAELTARYGLEGAGSLVDLLQAPVRGAMNLVLPENRQLQPVSAGGSIANALNLPTPQNATERVVGDISRTMVGTGTTMGLSGLASPATKLGQNIQTALATNAPAQLGGAVGAGTAGGLTREAGGGELAQLTASLLGGLGGGSVGNMFTPKPIIPSVKQLQNAPRDKVLKEAQAVGYVALPSEVGAGAGSRAMETVSGKYKIQELASAKNQQVTNNLTRKYLGLPQEVPLTEQTFTDLRDSLAEPYRQAQDLPPTQIGTTSSKSMSTGQIVQTPVVKSGADLVEAIKTARDTSRAAWKSFSSGMASNPTEARKIAVDADNQVKTLENQLEKVAVANNQPDLVAQLKQARVEIAKVHTVEKATNPITGSVNARQLAKQMDKNVPLSGELELAAKFSKTFPNVTKVVTEHPNAFSIYDVIGAAAGAGAQNPFLLGVPALRVAGRYGALSKPIQQKFVQPQYPTQSQPFVPYMGLLNSQGQ